MGEFMNDPGVSRQAGLDAWLRSMGLSYADLARQYGCHPTFPGKVLRAETDEMPRKFRGFMLGLGCPEELLPRAADKKREKTRNQKRYARAKESARQARIDKIRAERENRVRKDIPITAGV